MSLKRASLFAFIGVITIVLYQRFYPQPEIMQEMEHSSQLPPEEMEEKIRRDTSSTKNEAVKNVPISMHAPTQEPVKYDKQLNAKYLKPASVPRYPTSESLKDFSLHPSWKLWHNTSAIPASEVSREDRVLGEVGGFSLIEGPRDLSTEESFFSGRPLVVFNDRLKSAGVVTGVLKTRLQPGQAVEDVQKAYDLSLVHGFPHLNLYHLTSRVEPFNLRALSQTLSQDPRVKKVEVEIVSKTYEKK